jgi:hypothetical protein
LCLCWRLADALRVADPVLFAEQETFSSTFRKSPSLAAIAFSPNEGGDLCCTPAGVAWLVAAACGCRGAGAASTTQVRSAAALEGCFLRAAAAACSDGGGVPSRCSGVLIVGKCRDEWPLEAPHGTGGDASGDPGLARSLDHWFVVTDLAERPSQADASRRFAGKVWNFTGNGGAAFLVGAGGGLTAAVWREELSITHVIIARRPV